MASCRRAAAQARTARLWKEFFRDPSQWLDYRNSKKHARAADFRHKTTDDSLWLHSCHNPSWVLDMLNFEHPDKPISQNVPKENKCWHLLSLDEALSSLEQGLHPLPTIEGLASIVHKCKTERSQEHALRMHSYTQNCGLSTHVSLGNCLVSMLAEVASLDLAQQVFDRLVYCDEHGWNSLIMAYCRYEEPHNAFALYNKMQESGDHPWLNGNTFIALLKACALLNDLTKAFELHAEIARKGLLETDTHICTTLIDMYGKCGSLAKAHEVFDTLFVRDVVTWTALVAGYVQHGYAEKALNFFHEMQQQGVSPDSATFVCILKACGMLGDTKLGQKMAQKVFDALPMQDLVFWNALIAGFAEHGHGDKGLKCYKQMKKESIFPEDVTFVCLLKACASIGALNNGQELHSDISKAGFERDIPVGSSLVDMYAKCGSLIDAQDVFDKLPVRGVVTWNALMSGYADICCDGRVFDCFRRMQLADVSPDAVSYVCCLKACSNSGNINKGHEIHIEIIRKGLDRDIVVGSTLVDMYGKCGLLAKAREVFDKLPICDAISWNALISGYVDNGQSEEALVCFEQMQQKGICPHMTTFVCTLKACASIRNVCTGQKIHIEIVRRGLEKDIVVGSTLIDFYVKCGLLLIAQRVFDKLPTQDVVLWNALIMGYTSYGCGKNALECFDVMQQKGICPDDFTYACILKVCGKSEGIVKNQELHIDVTKRGWETDLFVGSTLVDVYAKCGSPEEAQATFVMLPAQDVVAWTALVAGYALQLGETHNVMHVFERMIEAGIEPNLVTLVSVLAAFSHAGQVDKARLCIEGMSNAYGFIPHQEHYTCMLDLLGRAGHMNEAVAMIKMMPFHPGIVVWDTMLGACRKWGELELGRHAFQHAVRLDEKNTAAYVCMSNMFVDAAIRDFDSQVNFRKIAAAA